MKKGENEETGREKWNMDIYKLASTWMLCIFSFMQVVPYTIYFFFV